MSSDWVAYVDGEWGPAEEARVDVLDHGLLYGDGVFEGIRFYGREPFLLDAHLRAARGLGAGARARPARSTAPASRRALPRGRARAAPRTTATCASSSPAAAARSASRRTPAARPAPDPDRGAARALPAGGAAARRAARHLGPAPRGARRAAAAGQEPQLPDERARLDRGAPAGRRGGDPAQRAGPDRGVHGRQPLRRAAAGACARRRSRTARSTASRARSCCDLLAELGIPAEAAPLVPVDAWTADELFLTGTGAEIVRVREVDGRPVGEHGRPVTERVERAFADYVAGRSWVEPSTARRCPPGGSRSAR